MGLASLENATREATTEDESPTSQQIGVMNALGIVSKANGLATALPELTVQSKQSS